ncbi:phosphoribosylformylglycinamidine synthase subunit PurS [Candidatus Saccharibacteria bacterium]|nr:phosphoribosylformylglycinamidine synthase subunit PurS [Candidatus Saccharibacteria bacterium]
MSSPENELNITKVLVQNKPGVGDPGGGAVTKALLQRGIDTGSIATGQVYYLQGLTPTEVSLLAEQLLCNPVSQTHEINPRTDYGDPAYIEAAYQPGVTDPNSQPIVDVARRITNGDVTGQIACKTAVAYQLSNGELGSEVTSALINPQVQEQITEIPNSLIIKLEPGSVDIVEMRNANDEQLMELSSGKLFLNLDEMRIIQDYYKDVKQRDPTDAELETFAAVWSEHCCHKSMNAVILEIQPDGSILRKPSNFSKIKESAKKSANYDELVLSAFHDNAGVIKLFDGFALAMKGETHNSPSGLDPYGGAMTGSGGIYRDIYGTGLGARVIISTDIFCLAPPDMNPALVPLGAQNPWYMLNQVVKGVGDYGNRMGYPTGNGSFHFDPRFAAKPTVLVGAFGIMPESRAEKGVPEIGDLVVAFGGRTGKDGIHGATFSSGSMTSETKDINSGAVQIGDAITEQKMSKAINEAADLGLFRAITDCGAAGFNSAIGEMGENTGVRVDLSKAPTKYEGLKPWEIWISESQERMVAAISPENIEKFRQICKKYDVENVVLGEFNGSNNLTVTYGDEMVVDLDYDFLKHGLPQREMLAKWEASMIEETKPETPQNNEEWASRFEEILSHWDVCSKEDIVRRYDHGVGGGTITYPYGGVDQSGPNDGFVVRPELDKEWGVVQAHGLNPRLNDIDPYYGTITAFAEALSNYVSAGGDIGRASAVGNYITPTPGDNDPSVMGAVCKMTDAACDMMEALGVPVISGKDSMSSTYINKETGEVIKIPPVYCAQIAGGIENVDQVMTSELKKPGETVLMLAGYPQYGMGGSIYYEVTGGSSENLPKIDPYKLKATLNDVHALIKNGDVLACHDISDGGLATAAIEMCFGSQPGAGVELSLDGADLEQELFSETVGCFVIEVSPEQADDLKGKDGFKIIGKTTNDGGFTVKSNGEETIYSGVGRLKNATRTLEGGEYDKAA